MPRLVVDAVRFLLEIGALVAVAAWGVHVADTTALKVLSAVALPLVVAGLWGRFAAPRSKHRLAGWGLLGVEVVVFGGATLAIIGVGAPWLGLAFAAVAAVDTALIHVRPAGPAQRA